MDSVIKQSIDGRKEAFTNCYEITDATIKNKIDDLFKRIGEFGKSCSDIMDFETKFATSPLGQEYNSLFTEVASKCKPIIREQVVNNVKSDKEYYRDEAISDAKYIAKEATMPARRAAREAFDSKMRDTPLGTIEQASNTAWVFKRLFGKKKKDDE